MTQDQNAQTSNANDTIIPPVSEQDLQDITGGCLSCGVVAAASAVGGLHEQYKVVSNAFAKQDPKEAEKYGQKGAALMAVANDSYNNFRKGINTEQPTWKPCRACKVNAALALVTKLWRP